MAQAVLKHGKFLYCKNFVIGSQSQGYSFQIEMNFRSWRLGARIKEESIIFLIERWESQNVEKHCF